MASFYNEDHHGHLRTFLKILPGEKVKLCRCSKSATYPYCDSAHKQFDFLTGPLFVEVETATENSQENTDS